MILKLAFLLNIFQNNLKKNVLTVDSSTYIRTGEGSGINPSRNQNKSI